MGSLTPQRLGDPVPCPAFLSGRQPQLDGSLTRLVEGKKAATPSR